jgi:hypothetical protein
METETVELLESRDFNFLLQKCQGCGMRILLDPGDVIFGGKWYHRACWNTSEDMTAAREAALERHLNEETSQNVES